MAPVHKLRSKPLLLCALAVALLAILLVALWPREPHFQGRSLSYWLDALPESRTTPGQETLVFKRGHFRESLLAVNYFGDRCLPALLRRLRTKDTALTRLHETVSQYAVNIFHSSKAAWTSNAAARRHQAITGFIQLGDRARSAFPVIFIIAKTDPDPAVRADASEVCRLLSTDTHAQAQAARNSRTVAAPLFDLP